VNEGDEPFQWEAGGCAVPVEVTVGGSAEASTWDGSLASLDMFVQPSNPRKIVARDEARSGLLTIECTSESRLLDLKPGDRLAFEGTVDLRLPPGTWGVTARFQPYRDGVGAEPLMAQSTITIEATTSEGEPYRAMRAFAADERLEQWVTENSSSAYQILFSKWGDDWQMWLTTGLGAEELRLSFDPSEASVTTGW
jgi:hypothetical protein